MDKITVFQVVIEYTYSELYKVFLSEGYPSHNLIEYRLLELLKAEYDNLGEYSFEWRDIDKGYFYSEVAGNYSIEITGVEWII